MMDDGYRRDVLVRGRPGPLWPGEPLLGGHYGEEEVEAVVEVMRASMDPTVGFGFICEEIERFEAEFASYCGTKYCVSINGAGTGLDMALMALDLQPDDEVIVPAVNFRAAHLAVIGRGARLVLGEVDPQTLNLDPNHVEQVISARTRAICPVHMNGLSAPMDAYEEIAVHHPHPVNGPAKVIGDAARACGGEYKGEKIGKAGWANVFSFHTQKLMTTLGEGGAITTDDPELAERLRAMRMFGASTRTGPVTCWGSNYKLTKVQAAVGLVQLAKLDQLIDQRRQVAHARQQLLQGIPEVTLPYEPPESKHAFYLYTLLVPREWAGSRRDHLIQILRDEYEVDAVVENPAVHLQYPLIRAYTNGQHVPIAEEVGERLLCIAIHPAMTTADNEYISAALWTAVESVGAVAAV